MEKISKKRINWIDQIKGIGILLVMISHFYHISTYWSFGYIPLFFICSAITWSYKNDYIEYIKNKAKRILVPYFFYSTCIVILETFREYELKLPNIVGVFYGRISLQTTGDQVINWWGGGGMTSNAPMWFLPCFFIVLAMIPLIHQLGRFRLLSYVTFVGITLLLSDIPYLLPWSIDVCFLFALFFELSYWSMSKMKTYIENAKSNKFLMAISIVIALVLYIVIATINPGPNMSIRYYGMYGYLSILFFYAGSVLYFFLLMIFCRSFEKLPLMKIFSYLGTNSMRLLCIHLIIQTYTSAAINKIMLLNDIGRVLFVPFYIIEVLAINYLMQLIINKHKEKCIILKYI